MTTRLGPTPLDIYAARRRLVPHLQPTPLIRSDWLSSRTGANVYLKVESVQLTNSFKIRGALNAALKITETDGSVGGCRKLVAASAGNHGRAMAIAAEILGMHATIFTPASAPDTKKSAIRRHGADLRDEAPDYDAAEREARRLAEREHSIYVSPYNHADVIAGAGTIALEILDALPAVDIVVAPVGGGGLISGLAIAMKAATPSIRFVGVEVDASTPFAVSLAAGVITTIRPRPSLADGLIGNLEPGAITFELVRRYVDSLVSVDETALEDAIRGLLAEEHLVAEGAGAAATAAVLARGAVKPGQRAVAILTGSNIDLDTLLRVVR